MFFITNAELIAAAKNAYDNKTLTVFNELPEEQSCVYSGAHNKRCAIGAALNDAEIAWIRQTPWTESDLNKESVLPIIAKSGCPFTFESDLFAFKLQRRYDLWCVRSASGTDARATASAKSAFLRLLS